MGARGTDVSLMLSFIRVANSGGGDARNYPCEMVNDCAAYARFLQAKCLVGDDPR